MTTNGGAGAPWPADVHGLIVELSVWPAILAPGPRGAQPAGGGRRRRRDGQDALAAASSLGMAGGRDP